jgi:hypothetical protein
MEFVHSSQQHAHVGMEMDNGEEEVMMDGEDMGEGDEEEDPDFVPRKGPLFPAVSATDAGLCFGVYGFIRSLITANTSSFLVDWAAELNIDASGALRTA